MATDRFDIESALLGVSIRRHSGNALDTESAKLGDTIVAGLRREFPELDPETCGLAMVIAAGSVIPLLEHEIPPAVLVNIIGFAGQRLVSDARKATVRDGD